MRTFQLPVILLILCIVLAYGCNGPELTTVEYGEIDTSQEPVQTPYERDEPFTITIKDGQLRIKPLAEYKISAVVAGKESYSYGWSGKVAPVDLALAWGKIAEPENKKISPSVRATGGISLHTNRKPLLMHPISLPILQIIILFPPRKTSSRR